MLSLSYIGQRPAGHRSWEKKCTGSGLTCLPRDKWCSHLSFGSGQTTYPCSSGSYAIGCCTQSVTSPVPGRLQRVSPPPSPPCPRLSHHCTLSPHNPYSPLASSSTLNSFLSKIRLLCRSISSLDRALDRSNRSSSLSRPAA